MVPAAVPGVFPMEACDETADGCTSRSYGIHKPGNGYMPVDKELSSDRIGKETFWILHTTDFDAMVKHLRDGGVRFRSETYPLDSGGKEIVFEDLYGNLWVLQQAPTY
jgi:hypothetical protein